MAHPHKIQESTLQGHRNKSDGKIKAYFGSEITLDDCSSKLLHGFYESLRAEGVSERTVIHYHNLLHAAFYGVRRSEALWLSWDNIDFERKEIHICQKAMESLIGINESED